MFHPSVLAGRDEWPVRTSSPVEGRPGPVHFAGESPVRAGTQNVSGFPAWDGTSGKAIRGRYSVPNVLSNRLHPRHNNESPLCR